MSYGVKGQFTSNKSYQTTIGKDGTILPDGTSSVDNNEMCIRDRSKKLLQYSVIGLGFGMNVNAALASGSEGMRCV